MPSFSLIVLVTVAVLAASICWTDARLVCPQMVANDPSPKFCARNAYGQLDVTRSEFENWNCNHPKNQYVYVSAIACTPVPTTPTCTPSTCDQTGPLVCAQLKSTDPSWPNAFTTAVFGNQCQLTLYNCMNPTQQYSANTKTIPNCKSVG